MSTSTPIVKRLPSKDYPRIDNDWPHAGQLGRVLRALDDRHDMLRSVKVFLVARDLRQSDHHVNSRINDPSSEGNATSSAICSS